MNGRPPFRPIKRLLVTNRGEIAIRILSAARELDIETFSIYTEDDSNHTYYADHAIRLSSPSDYMNISSLVEIAKNNSIDTVHPGYGFLSESADFSQRMWEEAKVVVIGPGWDVLSQTGDKLKAKELAETCGVPVLKSALASVYNYKLIDSFLKSQGLPLMVKSVDGGGGRGIRLVENMDDLKSSMKRASEESPSKKVFLEKAAVNGFRHIEIQIIGDGRGNVTHLWERDCSIQRRFQKIVEVAPSTINESGLMMSIIQSSVLMAKTLDYLSLGTFEFLANPKTEEYYFLEINPRLQVEHTVTEQITGTDLVRAQMLLAQGCSLEASGIQTFARAAPSSHSIQLRIVAEDPTKDWRLSVGKIKASQFPSGNGIRVDTHLLGIRSTVVGTNFDSLIAKLIVTASTRKAVISKAMRALKEVYIDGVESNVPMLTQIISHPDFANGKCDAKWLERNHADLLEKSIANGQTNRLAESLREDSFQTSSSLGVSQSEFLVKSGDAWSIDLSPIETAKSGKQQQRHLAVTKVLRNEFPSLLSANIVFTNAQSSESPKASSIPYRMTVQSTVTSSQAAASGHKRGDPANPRHIVIPFSGKLIEVLVDEDDIVRKGDVICIVQQMKMELEVRSGIEGRVSWLLEAEDGEEVFEGMLAAEVELSERFNDRPKGKL